MNNPGTDYDPQLVRRQRLNGVPAMKWIHPPVPLCFQHQARCRDARRQGCNEECRVFDQSWPGAFPFRAFGVGQEYDCQGHHGRSALRKEVLWALDLGDGDMHVLARSFKDRSQTELAAVQMVPQDPATSSIPRFAWTPSFLAPSGGCILAGRGKR